MYKPLAMIASKDQARPILTGVNFTNKLAEATDGYKMSWYSYDKNELTDDYPKGEIVPSEAILNGLKLAAKSPIGIIVGKGVINTANGNLTYNKLEGEYPATDKLVGQLKGKRAVRVGLDIRLLGEILAAHKAAGDTQIILSIIDEGDTPSLKPVFIKGKELKSLLMPIRIKDK